MSILAKKVDEGYRAVEVFFTDNQICVVLSDGREVRTPLIFYPTLQKASANQLNKFKIIGLGTGIHWPDLDEDLSVEGIVTGRKSYDFSS